MKHILIGVCVCIVFSLLGYYLYETFGKLSLVFGSGWIGAIVANAIRK